MRTNYIYLWIAAIAFAGCSTNENVETTIDDRMQFDVIHPQQTRATSTAFEATDRVGLFVTEKDAPLQLSGNYVNNALLTYSGSTWTPNRTIYWNEGAYDVFAYYPYTTPVPSVDDYPISVATDQTTVRSGNELGGYEASDFLWAQSKGVTASASPVSLGFKHIMSRMVIRLIKGDDFEGELPEDAEVYIHNTVTDATIDLSVGVVTKHPYGTEQSIKTISLGNHQYASIVVPQRLVNRRPLIEVIMKGVSYLMESTFVFKPGIQHTVSLVISKNPEQVKIEIGGELEHWD